MMLFDKIDENAAALRQIGMIALAEAKKAGTFVAYMDPAYGDDIIREYPDGRRERIDRANGGCAIAIPPRDAQAD
jgi:hypothetical protein